MSRHRCTLLAVGLLCLWAAGPAEAASLKAQAATARAKMAAIKKTAAKVRKYPYASRTLRLGMSGMDVMKLQKYLNGLAYPGTVDGAFGPGTKTSVVGFERARTLKIDGVVQRKEAKKIRTAAKAARRRIGAFVFPVPGPHNFGGPDAAFGAPRNGHTHQGQDIIAACSLPVVAAQGGTLRVNAYQASGAGYYVVIQGATTGEDYVYMHLAAASPVPVGAIVAAGQGIGNVGTTGDATGCHLHFEMWTVPGWYLGGYPYDPLPSLQLWDSYS